MSAYTRSGRSDQAKIEKTKGSKRPIAAIENPATRAGLLDVFVVSVLVPPVRQIRRVKLSLFSYLPEVLGIRRIILEDTVLCPIYLSFLAYIH